MYKLSATLFIAALSLFQANTALAQVYSVAIPATEAPEQGFYIRKVWLDNAALPTFQVPAQQWRGLMASEEKSLPMDERERVAGAGGVAVQLGFEKKRPFALVRIPAYRKEASGQWMKMMGMTVVLNETQAPRATANKGTGIATASVLATGTWRKLALQQRGIYRVDYAMLTAMGFSGGVASSAIHLHGNGGTMLPETNLADRPDDLIENAVDMHDGGDGTFDAGDYLLFYANGPTAWTAEPATRTFSHAKNIYADSSYYFLTVDAARTGLRMEAAQAPNEVPTTSITAFDAYAVHENDDENPGKFGRTWWGDKMSGLQSGTTTRDIAFSFPAPPDTLRVSSYVAARSATAGSAITISVNGAQLGAYSFGSVLLEEDTDPVKANSQSYVVKGDGATTTYTFHYEFDPAAIDAVGYIDYLRVNARCPLRYNGGQLSFRDLRTLGGTARWTIQNATSGMSVWDVTDPLHPALVQLSGSGGSARFDAFTDVAREYLATDATYLTPADAGAVQNQNLHGMAQQDLVIIAPRTFGQQAEELAQMHRDQDGLRVAVAFTDEIYNEFSSGGQDIGAIRDLVKMLYDRAGTDPAAMPKNMLLFGDASYDYKNRIGDNTNYVPVWEAPESISANAGISCDDFYAFLDDGESINGNSLSLTMDVGIGRLTVRNAAEAQAMVDKIKIYHSPASLGPWRISNTYVADNADGAGNHLDDAEYMSTSVNGESILFNDTKIYLDGINFVSTPGGNRAPDANKAINDGIYKGTALINYSGHGSPTTLAHERVLTADDYNTWKNLNALPFMVTATCDFARFDRPANTSSGEDLVLKPDGGSIAMLTTTQLVYSSGSRPVNASFLTAQYQKNTDGRWNTFGEAFRIAKNHGYATSGIGIANTRAYTLLGDPALQPCFPKELVRTDSIIDLGKGEATNQLSALGRYQLSGSVTDNDGNVLTAFDGQVHVTIYDKTRSVTLALKNYPAQSRTYGITDNVIYKGQVSVSGGHFTTSFVAPKDINYAEGRGKISYYADNGAYDAAGGEDSLVIGGYSDYPVDDDQPPVVRPFIGDSTFRDGGITGAGTLLYVRTTDETGINVTGNSIGHDLVAILDGNESMPYVMNDYYETFPNNYREGVVKFPIEDLLDGRHTLTVRAWDMANNSGEGRISFRVVNGAIVQVDDLMNYPNPFKDETHFVFKHNHPGEAFTAEVMIVNTTGARVRLLRQAFTNSDASRSNEIVWDGTDEYGAKLPAGIYPYHMVLTTAKGATGSAYQKAVLVR